MPTESWSRGPVLGCHIMMEDIDRTRNEQPVVAGAPPGEAQKSTNAETFAGPLEAIFSWPPSSYS